jgi:hypothetical protein
MAELEENGSADFYRPQGTTCRDNGRFTITVPEAHRFWSKVALRAGPQHCWLWLGGRTIDGYGRFRITVAPGVYQDVRAHRYVYELVVGPIPAGLTIDHKCGRPRCVRPSHLEPVTNAENLRRRHARRRHENGATP